MAFFALPDVKPPAEGTETPFHGLDMTQFDALICDRGSGVQRAGRAEQRQHERRASVLGVRDAVHRRHVRAPEGRVSRASTPYKTAYTDLRRRVPAEGQGRVVQLPRPRRAAPELGRVEPRRPVPAPRGQGLPDAHVARRSTAPRGTPTASATASASNRQLAARTMLLRARQESYLDRSEQPARVPRGSQRRRRRRVPAARYLSR